MNDFEKNITIRLEKAASRTLNERLNSVDWERLPVKKVIGGTILAILAYKLALPACRFLMGLIAVVFLALVLLSVLVVMYWVFLHTPPDTQYHGYDYTDLLRTPAPRAELINPHPHHR